MIHIYGTDEIKINNLINYLVFKLDCAREQKEVGCKTNLSLVNQSLQELHSLRDEKLRNLIEAIPKSITYKEVRKPNKVNPMQFLRH